MTFKLTCEASKQHGELIASIISETLEDDAAVSLMEARNGWRIEAYFANEPDLDSLRAVLAAALGGSHLPSLDVEELPDTDWVTTVQRGLVPILAGPFIIHGSHDRQRIGKRRFAIEIEAGRAFGTAHHGTTQGCLRALAGLACRKRLAKVLDVGTGSGVLAIAAARAGAGHVLATDIDPVAAAVARENCRKNGASVHVTVITAPGLRHSEIRRWQPFDLIMANILAKPLLSLSQDMRRAAKPGTMLILSGLLDNQAREILGRYRSAGFFLRRRLSIDGWTTLVLMRH